MILRTTFHSWSFPIYVFHSGPSHAFFLSTHLLLSWWMKSDCEHVMHHPSGKAQVSSHPFWHMHCLKFHAISSLSSKITFDSHFKDRFWNFCLFSKDVFQIYSSTLSRKLLWISAVTFRSSSDWYKFARNWLLILSSECSLLDSSHCRITSNLHANTLTSVSENLSGFRRILFLLQRIFLKNYVAPPYDSNRDLAL